MLRRFFRVSRFLVALSCVSLFAASAEAVPLVNGLIDDFAVMGSADLLANRSITNALGPFTVGSGVLDFGPGTQITLTYDGGLNSDFLAHGSIIEIPVISLGGGTVDLAVTVIDGSAASDTVTLMGISTPLVQVSFGSFTGIDFSDVDSIEFDFTAASGNPSFVLDEIRVVPEPATSMLMGLGLFGLAAAGRRKSV